MYSLQLVVAQARTTTLPGKGMKSSEAFQPNSVNYYKSWARRQLAVSKEALIQMLIVINHPGYHCSSYCVLDPVWMPAFSTQSRQGI